MTKPKTIPVTVELPASLWAQPMTPERALASLNYVFGQTLGLSFDKAVSDLAADQLISARRTYNRRTK